ncbi:alpha/beta hydrolase [Paenibacillus sp. FJAT-26967]|uniref:alpha/beta hydrolase n=1 Tax=Paenibacillus sp. FJAT-26967 TaxID=1729690 RepID=UPI0008397380|nr:alpha/beta hydrolase [Paenibacillus sp. FJAT-26967]
MLENEEFVDLYDQGKLAGILHLPPKHLRPCPVVIYCPGKNGERYEVHRLAVKFARRLAERGIAFLRFDYYGIGLSDGNYYDMTTSGKVSNVEKAYEFVSRHPELDASRTVLLGFSDGARIALMSALRTRVRRTILWSPLFYEFGGNYPGGRHPRFTRHRNEPGKLVMPWAGLWVGMEFYRDLQSLDTETALKSYAGNSLLIYGDNDPLIQEEMSLSYTDQYAIYSGTDKNRVVEVPEAGHLFTSRPLEETLMEQTEAWLRSEQLVQGG